MFINTLIWILKNFSFALFLVAVMFSCVQWAIHHKTPTYEIFYRWVTLALGISSLYTFIMHAFYPASSAAIIGWQTSPFQFEVAVANFSFGVIALISFHASYGFRLANVIGNSCWLMGDAIGHIYQMITFHNFNPGNAGSWFWMDIIIPLVLMICISRMRARL